MKNELIDTPTYVMWMTADQSYQMKAEALALSAKSHQALTFKVTSSCHDKSFIQSVIAVSKSLLQLDGK